MVKRPPPAGTPGGRRAPERSGQRGAARRRERVVPRLELVDGQHDDALGRSPTHEPPAVRQRVGGVGGGARVEFVDRALPQAAVVVDDAARA